MALTGKQYLQNQSIHGLWLISLFFVLFLNGCTILSPAKKGHQPSAKLNLDVVDVRDIFAPYQEFCRNFSRECVLSGQAEIRLTPDLFRLLKSYNRAVNLDIKFMSDKDQYDREDLWTLPLSGYGDCEDIALEKRRKLSLAGLSRAALRIAIGHHKQHLTPHAVLTVETNQGTFILDSESDLVYLWFEAPYNLESRERPDGSWERFNQETWEFH